MLSCHDPDNPIMLYKNFEYVKPKNPKDSSKSDSHILVVAALTGCGFKRGPNMKKADDEISKAIYEKVGKKSLL